MMCLDKPTVIYRGNSLKLKGEIFTYIDGEKVPYTMPLNIPNAYILFQVRNTEFYQGKKGTIYNYFVPAKGVILETDVREPMYVSDIHMATIPNVLYYTIDNYGNRTYYYYDNGPVEYKCEFERLWLSIDTKDLRQQTWWYNVFLVSGVSMLEYLQSVYDSYKHEEVDSEFGKVREEEYNSRKWLYYEICKLNPSFEGTVDPESPLSSATFVDTLLKTRKLIVM